MVTLTYERALERRTRQVLAEAVRICEIPAPSYREQERAKYVHGRFEAIGCWDDLRLDPIANVVAVRRGVEGASRTLVAAHLDTVFPDTEVRVTRGRGRLTGPGIGDNSVAVAALLAVGEVFRDAPPRGIGDVILAANVCEEGRGDLRGIRRLVKDYAGQFDRVIAVEGLSLDRVQVGSVASLRYQVSVTTAGGHSYGAYGRPNAIAALARAITALEPLMPATGISPKTTMNVGVVHGGRSVNTIAPYAAFELDIRSEAPATLASLDRRAKRAMREAVAPIEGADFSIRRIGNRPGGRIERDDPLVGAVLEARGQSGLREPDFGFGSTDANLPMSLGIPATCIGVTTGGEAHTPREWMRTSPVRKGLPYLGRAIANAGRLSR
ncbi:MAG: M20/M25/M40 family metallo-hydrolase [Dehalococcoidia bacterium]|nr:M20/M25/M40 family metallo-hydrolase [Dehalococcoidia bacterium]